MGFMDKFKDAAQQAQDATKAAGGSIASLGGMGGAADTAAKANKIAQQGIKHPAILKGMRETGNKDPLSGGIEFELEVEVRPADGQPYAATFSQQVIAGSVDAYKQKIGGEIVVNVDPDDPQSMLLWG
jgi:hypothetical protein